MKMDLLTNPSNPTCGMYPKILSDAIEINLKQTRRCEKC